MTGVIKKVLSSAGLFGVAQKLYHGIYKAIRSTSLYRAYDEPRIIKSENAKLLEEAKRRFTEEKPKYGSIEDFSYCFNKYRVNYSEYMYQYEFWKLNDEQRHEFVTRAEMQSAYRRYLVKRKIEDLMTNKVLFLKTYSDYIRRKWMLVSEHTFKEFLAFGQQFDCIAKPLASSCGKGVFLVRGGGNFGVI